MTNAELKIWRKKKELNKINTVPKDELLEMHARNVQLYQHGVCTSGNRLINSILDQVYAKRDNTLADVCQPDSELYA